jgi:4-carboxymuconolactone decarboxylase
VYVPMILIQELDMTRVPYAELPPELPIHNNLVRSMHHNQDLFRSFGGLSMKVHSASHLDQRTRELAILRLVAKLGATYEWGNHAAGANASGVDDDEIRAIRDGNLGIFSARDAAVMRYAEAVEDRAVTDAVWSEVSTHLDSVQLVDLTVLVGFYGLASRYVMALDVDLDPGLRGFESP